MFSKQIKLLKIGGVQISLDFSWFWIFLLVAVSFYFSTQTLNLSKPLHYTLALSGAILFFCSVLLHELSHTFIANRYGLVMDTIILFIFGGVSNLTQEPKKPKIELFMALAGPAASVILGFIFLGLYYLTVSINSLSWLFVNLSYLNFLLAVFNIIPAFPLDGGRVFRSYIWAKTGNLDKATELASLAGKIFALILSIWGIIQVIVLGVFSGFWLVFIGIFLYRMAALSPIESKVMRKIENIKVRDIQRDYPVFGSTSDLMTIIRQAINNFFDYIIVEKEDKVLGLLPVSSVVAGIDSLDQILAISSVPSIDIEKNLSEALRLMQTAGTDVIQVQKNGQFAGIVSISDIAKVMK